MDALRADKKELRARLQKAENMVAVVSTEVRLSHTNVGTASPSISWLIIPPSAPQGNPRRPTRIAHPTVQHLDSSPPPYTHTH